MTLKNYAGIIGALLVIAGGLSPMLHIPIIGNWNYWNLDIVLATIIYTLATLALIASASNKRGLLRFCGWSILLVLNFTFVAVYFKVDNYFSFIPFKKLAAAAIRVIHYRWMGWVLISSGGLIMERKNKN
jgi:hypothetical protein